MKQAANPVKRQIVNYVRTDRLHMKKIGLISLIILGALIILGIMAWIFLNNILNLFGNTPVPEAPVASIGITPSPSTTTLTASPTVSAASTAPASTTATLPVSPAAGWPIPTPATTTTAPSPSGKADIDFEIVSIDGSGFSRTVTGLITNIGNIDLHQCKLKVEILSRDKLIKNDGQAYIEKSYSLIAAGASVKDTVDIKLSLLDGLNVQRNGVSFVLTFKASEMTRTFTYDYQP
jgi:hypothetical protein